MSTPPSTANDRLPQAPSEQQVPSKTEWDELVELAAMTGYTPEPSGKAKSRSTTSELTAVAEPQNPSHSSEALLDQEDLGESEPGARTETPLWRNPMAKGGLVLVLMAIAFGSVGLIINSFNNGWHPTPNQPEPLAAAPQTSADANPEQAEIGRLKTINALGTQTQILKQSPQAATTRTELPATNTRQTRSRSTTSVQAPSAPRPQPAITYSPSSGYVPRAIAPAPAPIRNVVASRSNAPGATSEVEPAEAWQNALEQGSFGEADTRQVANGTTASQLSETASTPSQSGTIAQDQQVDNARYEADAAALLSGIPHHAVTVTPGTRAAATLITPVVWAQDLKPEQQPQRFELQLTQPLTAADGSVALPAGTQLVAQVDAISESGMVQLSVNAVIVPAANGNQVVEIPSGALLIAGKTGEPLIAENHNPSRRRIAAGDVNMALMGALSQVGALLNRPNQQTTMTSPYLSTTSIRNGQTSIVGGILQGAFDPLIQQAQQRQQQEIEEVLRRPNLWYVPAGEELQIFATSLFDVSL